MQVEETGPTVTSTASVVGALQSTFRALDQRAGGSYDPKPLVAACSGLRLAYGVNEQNDACELFTQLLVRVDEELKVRSRSRPLFLSASRSLPLSLSLYLSALAGSPLAFLPSPTVHKVHEASESRGGDVRLHSTALEDVHGVRRHSDAAGRAGAPADVRREGARHRGRGARI
jgi:hypothetical protein